MMNDIDYDELDRAVNSLNSDMPTSDPAPDDVNVAQGEEQQTSSPSPLASRRSTGRFMDVVHPSSDMRATPPLTIPPRKTSQDLLPKGDATTELPAPKLDTLDTESATDQSNTVLNNDWQSQVGAVDTTSPEAEQMESPVANDGEGDDIDKISDDINKSLGVTATVEPEASPLNTPFLTDAKIEKRPLGAFSDEAIQPAQIPTPVSTSNDNGEALPDELSSDLLSIEASSTTHPESAGDVVTTPEPTLKSEDSAEADKSPVEQATPANNPNSDVINGSINQQYKEQPSTSEQTNGAIYDTESYHKAALSYPAKKKPGLLWVLLILVLAVIGIGGGVAAYFLLLSN